MDHFLSLLTRKKQQLDQHQPLPPELVKNLEEWYKIELTYTSNAIEGNTLSRADTALVVEKGITVDGKTVNEHLEAINHAQALDLIRSLANRTKKELSEETILDIHRLVLSKIDDAHAGRYRQVPVRIAGSRVILPNALKVPELMTEFMDWLQSDINDHSILIAAQAHYRLVTIHPFVDGNGRMARLVMNLLLAQAGYPPAIIHPENRGEYIHSLEQAQLGGSTQDFYKLIATAVEQSLDIYLEAAEGVVK